MNSRYTLSKRIQALRDIPLFRELPEEVVASLAARMQRRRYPQGAIVFRQGDIGDAMYVVETGQVAVISEETGEVLAYLGPGSFVGEIALLLEQPRSATLRVIIDAELLSLHKQDFDALLAEYPHLALHMTREIGQRLVRTSHQSAPPRKKPVTAVWGIDEQALAQLAHAIAAYAGAPAALLTLPSTRNIPNLPEHYTEGSDPIAVLVPLNIDDYEPQTFTDAVSRFLEQYGHILLLLPDEWTPVAQKSIQLADHVVAIGGAPTWLTLQGNRELSIIATNKNAILHTARVVTGRQVGVALSSGGSKTLAHIGVLRVLEREGVPIDMLAGTSGGAFVSAFYALGYNADELAEFVKTLPKVNTWRNWDINIPPLSGLIKGHKAYQLLEDWFDGKTFADTKIPLFVVAADLATGEEIVFDRGSLANAVRASVSIPVIADPWRYQERFFVDGAVVNPFPVSVLRERGANVIIGSSVVHTETDPNLPSFEEKPNLLQTISRLINTVERKIITEQIEMVDVFIHPRVFADHSLDFSQVDRLVELGEQAAEAELDTLRTALQREHILPTPAL